MVDDPDFTKYDAYIGDIGVIYYEGEDAKPDDRLVQRRPVRQDTGQNPYETRPESGDIFSQGDFRGGSDQEHFHRPTSDQKKYLHSEGFNNAKEGRLRHLRPAVRIPGFETDTEHAAIGVGAGRLLLTQDNMIVTTTDFATLVNDNPYAGEAIVDEVYDVASRGERVYAALGVHGIHERVVAGTWANYNALDAIRVVWIRDRILAIGDDGRGLYELIGSGAATQIEVLGQGQMFGDIFVVGAFVYACVYSLDADEGAIHIYGMKEDLSGYEPKGRSEMPIGDLPFAGAGYMGKAYIGVGYTTENNGKGPIVYEGTPNQSGHLELVALAQADELTTAGAISVRSIIPTRDAIFIGWSLTAESPYGARRGLAKYDIVRSAFTHHLEFTNDDVAADARVVGITRYKGRTCFITYSESLGRGYAYFEDLTTYVSTATLITSMGTWNNAGLKTWSSITIACKPLPAGCAIDVYYTTKHPEENDWTLAGTIDEQGAESETFFIDDVTSVQFALKIVSRANITRTAAPEITQYSVRSDPKPVGATGPEIGFNRYIILADGIRKDPQAEPETMDVRERKDEIEQLAYSTVTLHEPEGEWRVQIVDFSLHEPAQPILDETSGDSEEELYILAIRFEGAKVA